MSISFFSFLMAILWCNIYVVVISLVRRRNDFIISFSIIPLVFLILVCVFRLLCSVEFSFTVVWGSEAVFPALYDFITMPLLTIPNGFTTICVFHVMLTVWVGGCICFLMKDIYQSTKLNKSLVVLSEAHDRRVLSRMEEIIENSRAKTKVKLVQSEAIITPMITGFFKPAIYLPDIELSDTELKNILLHEWTHFLHKDAWIKLFMYLIGLVFWWNPFMHLLKQDINHIQEIQCDLAITSKLDEGERIQYLESISKIAAQVCKRKALHLPVNTSALVSTKKVTKLEQRYYLVLDYAPKKWRRGFYSFLLCSLILASFLASYVFIIQPRYDANDVAGNEDAYDITPENAYLKANGDGTYSLYADEKYRANIGQINKEPYSSLPIK